MGVRAHHIKNIEYGDIVFSLSSREDEEFINLAGVRGKMFDNDSRVEFSSGEIEEIDANSRRSTKRTKEIIAGIKKLLEQSGEEYVLFDCF